MKPAISSAAIALTLACSAPLAQAQAMFDCDLLHGTWDGEHVYDNGSYSRWSAQYSPNGELEISFYDRQGQMVEEQTGVWECDGVWVTSAMEKGGELQVYSYRIARLTEQEYVYESALGPVFTSLKAD